MPLPSRFVVTSIVRRAGQAQASGFLRVVDWRSGSVLSTFAVPESSRRALDPNPRGGLRGARGVGVHGDRLVLANTERLLIFDRHWRAQSDFSHPLMGGVHDILPEAGGIWVACTNCDLLVRLDWEGRVVDSWEWRLDGALVEALGTPKPPPVDRELDYRDPRVMQTGVRNLIHLNGVARTEEGLLVSFGRILSSSQRRRQSLRTKVNRLVDTGALRRARNQRVGPIPSQHVAGSSFAIVVVPEGGSARVVAKTEETTVPNHNALPFGSGILYNDTNYGTLALLDPESSEPRARIPIPGGTHFVRGLTLVDDHTVLVGNQDPAAVYWVDVRRGKVLRTFELGGQPLESVYGVCLLPDDFDDPPGLDAGSAVSLET